MSLDLETLQEQINNNNANYVRYPGFGKDTGTTVNHIIVTLDPAPTAYTNGMGILLNTIRASTAASDINVNDLGVVAIYDDNGPAINLKANSMYSLKYESTSKNFILQGKGGGGNAIPAHLLLGDTATVDSGPIVGTGQLIGDSDRTTLINLANIGDAYNQPDIARLISAMGFPTITGENFQNVSTDIQTQKTSLVSKLAAIGVSAANTEALAALINKILVTVPIQNVLVGNTIAGQTGTMPNNGTLNVTLTNQGQSYSLPSGYIAGGTITTNISGLTKDVIISPNVVGGITGAAIASNTSHGSQTFNTAGTSNFTVPSGITLINVIACGGGGGASGEIFGKYAGGGGGGGLGINSISVTPGQVLPVTVGSGGAGGTGVPVAAGGNGGDSSVGNIIGHGGAGSYNDGNNSQYGAGGGAGSGYGIAGGTGSSVSGGYTSTGGAGGYSTYGTGGGDVGPNGSPGIAGIVIIYW